MQMLQGYPRANGNFGIRNNILVISLVHCSNSCADKIAAACDVASITIDTGCGEYKDQEARTNLGLIRAGTHPNTYGVLLLSLGCQWTDPEYMRREMEKAGTKVQHLCLQTDGGSKVCMQKGIEIVKAMQAEAAAMPRVPFPISKLVVSGYAGGSDWTSGLTSNLVAGMASDRVVQEGGASVSSCVRGAPGGEMHLVNIAATPEVGLKIIEVVEEYRNDVQQMTGQSIAEVNPTPGNKRGGLSTLTEKATGSVKYCGNEPIQGVLQVGDDVPGPGNWFLDNRQGGNDIYQSTATAMSHPHITLFTTGRGNPIGNACAVTIKITGNPETNALLGEEWIDYSAHQMLSGEKTAEQCTQELYELILEVCNGKLTKAELGGDYSYATPPFGKI